MMTKQTYWALIACIALSCESNPAGIISFPPAKLNPDDCTNNPAICTNGLHCDFAKHDCVPGPECTVSTQDADCKKPFPSKPYCVDISQENRCRQCRPSMGAADCASDAAKPFCGNDGACRACAEDKECLSGICLKAGDYPTPDAAMIGKCVSPDDIAYVNQDISCSQGGTVSSPTMPFCNITAAMAANKTYINVAASQASYGPVVLNVPGRNVVIVGNGRDSTPATLFDSVSVQAGTLAVSSARIIANAVSGASCTGATSSLYIVNAYVRNSGGRGIDASMNCEQLTVDRTLVDCDRAGIQRYGISVGDLNTQNTVYRIINTAVINCGNFGGVNELHAIALYSKVSGYFAFNTLTANFRGIQCSGAQKISNSIIAANMAAQVDICTVDQKSVITDNTQVDFVSIGSPKLQIQSTTNDMYVFDKAITPTGNQIVPNDYDGTVRPKGNGYDIGFQELK